MKRVALLAAVIAVMVAASASSAFAGAGGNGNGNPTPGCQSATWAFTETIPGLGDIAWQTNLTRCVPPEGSDVFSLSGTANHDPCATGTVSGTIESNAVNMEWSIPSDPCFGGTIDFTGTLKWGQGTGSGNLSDNGFPGTWTATKTS